MCFFVVLRVRREAWYTDVCLPCQPSYTLRELLYKARCMYRDPHVPKRLGIARARRFREHVEPLIGVFLPGGDAFDARLVNGCDMGQDVRDVPFQRLLDAVHHQQPLELTLDTGRSQTITFVVAVPRIDGVRAGPINPSGSNSSGTSGSSERSGSERKEEDSGEMSPERMLVSAHPSVTLSMVAQRLLGECSHAAGDHCSSGWALSTCHPMVRVLDSHQTLRQAGVLSGQLLVLKRV